MINELVDAIDNQLSSNYQNIHVRADYDALQSKHPLPAMMIETTGGQVQPDRGTGEIHIEAQFAVHVAGNFKTHGEAMTRALAFDLARFIHLRGWLPGADLSKVTSVARDEFSSDVDEVCVWRVEFSTVIKVGENQFDYSLLLAPDQVLASTTPEIGIPNEHHYEPIVESDV